MDRRALLLGIVLWAGCGPEPPFIRELKYSPNAALLNLETTISGMVAYTDQDNDISQSIIELSDPSGVTTTSPRLPIDNAGMGVVGMVNFTIKFTPNVTGTWTFKISLIDLSERYSNKLSGIIKVN